MSFYDLWSAVMISAIAGCVLVFSALIGSRLLAPFARERGKGISYECGMLPIGRNWAQVHVRYYLIAIQFIVFDLEIIFIMPWTLVFQELGARGLVTMGLFVGMLFLGFIYVWKKGALEWE